MKKTLYYIVFADMLFILILALSGFFGGALSDAIYYLAFLLPIALGFAVIKSGRFETVPLGGKMTAEGIRITAAAAAPILLIIFGAAFLTSLLLGLFTTPSVADVSGNIFSVIVLHAIVPAVFEELLFRYIPISLIAPHTRRGAVILSSLAFSLVHCDLFQVPYAFLAGIMFAVLDLACNSIIPSLLFHFLNNLISILWMRGSNDPSFALIFLIIFIGAALVSVIFMLIMRRKYAISISEIVKDERPVGFTLEFTVMLIALLFVAFASTFA